MNQETTACKAPGPCGMGAFDCKRPQYKYISLAPYYPACAYPEALDLIVQAVGSEREDELFYDYLLSQAPTEEQKRIITSIRNDERKHNRLFREMYVQLTGEEPPMEGETEFVKPPSYIAGIQMALFGELAAVEKYRRILFGLSYCLPYSNAVTEIYTDELKHADKWNYLYTLNTMNMMNTMNKANTADTAEEGEKEKES